VPSKITARPMRKSRRVTRGMLLIAVLWRKLTRKLAQNTGAGYRPERHYMRGPGPKWHERNTRNPGVTRGDRRLSGARARECESNWHKGGGQSENGAR
jgi:hypothetical protein